MTIVSPRDRLFTVETFLAWDGFDPNHHYQLIDGRIVMMAPTTRVHAWIVNTLSWKVRSVLEGSPRRAFNDAGVIRSPRVARWFEADLLVTEESLRGGVFERPLVLFEVLSPSSETIDRTVKLPDYRAIASVREIVLVDQARPFVEVHRRRETNRWDVILAVGLDATLDLETIALRLPLADLYRDVEFDLPETAP